VASQYAMEERKLNGLGVGRIVHYYENADAPPKPAIVLNVWNTTQTSGMMGVVTLKVFGYEGDEVIDMVPPSNDINPDERQHIVGYEDRPFWIWPPRV